MTMRPYRGIDTRVRDAKVRLALQEIDMFLREATVALSENLAGTPQEVDASAQFLVLSLHDGLAAERRAVVSAPLAATDGGANGTWTLSLNNAVPTITFAGTGAAGTDSAAALRTDAVLVFPQALRSVAATAGDMLTLTSDGTNLTLTPSLAGADLIFADQAAVTMARMFSTGGGDRGLWVNGHALIGQGTALSGTTPNASTLLRISEDASDTASGFTTGLGLIPGFNMDINGGTVLGATYDVQLNTGFDPDAVGAGSAVIIAHQAQISGSPMNVPMGFLSKAVGFQAAFSTVLALGTPQWTEMIGYEVPSSPFSVAGVAPARSYGVKINSAGNGTLQWALAALGLVQIASTNKLGLGRAITIQPTNSFRARTSTGSNIVLELNSADEYEWDTAAFFSVTNGANGLGKNDNGWLDLWLKDTAAAFETRIIATSTGITADNTLTLNLGNASRIVTLTGNPTLADWFDQNVKTTGTPQFTRLGIGAAADGTVLLNVNDSVAAPSTSALTGFTSKYGGDTIALGDPAAWLRIRVAGSTYKVPLFT